MFSQSTALKALPSCLRLCFSSKASLKTSSYWMLCSVPSVSWIYHRLHPYPFPLTLFLVPFNCEMDWKISCQNTPMAHEDLPTSDLERTLHDSITSYPNSSSLAITDSVFPFHVNFFIDCLFSLNDQTIGSEPGGKGNSNIRTWSIGLYKFNRNNNNNNRI